MKKRELLLNYAVVFGPFVIGLGVVRALGLATLMPRTTFWGMMALFLLGFALFATAKFSVIKQGQLFTFGPSQMSTKNRMAYFLGYGGMIFGLFLLIGSALAVR